MTKILVNISSLVEVPYVNHGVIGASDDLFTNLVKKIPLGMEMDSGNLVLVALERAK